MASFLVPFGLLATLTVAFAGDEKPEGMAGGTTTSAGSLFNITKILNKHPDYSSFNSLLSQHKVADMINRRKTITVLAVKDTSAITEHPDDAVTRILMNHVILDFWGLPKLRKLKKPTVMTTMLQTTGAARLRQGFINTTKTEDGDVVMGSAVPDSDHNSKVDIDKAVFMQPWDVVVLDISNPIIAPGVDKMNVKALAPTDARAPRSAGAPTPEMASPPEAEEAGDEEDSAESPSPSGKKRAKAPAPDTAAAVAGAGMSSGAVALMGLLWLLA